MTHFRDMLPEEKLSYVMENLKSLPEGLVDEGIDLLVQANEIEYAAVLARDHERIGRAIEILVDSGDYLWAALIAKNEGWSREAERLYREGLDYYIGMDMYGRAVSAAIALKLPAEQIDALYREGVASESRKMDTKRTAAVMEMVAASLESAILDRNDQLSKELKEALYKEMYRENEEDD